MDAQSSERLSERGAAKVAFRLCMLIVFKFALFMIKEE
jgi:hypothetical protein